jgi:1-deoxy-D-xylulose-5-phosphate synthase
MTALLPLINSPSDLHKLTDAQLHDLAQEMRDELVRVLSIRPAHFASNLGVIELCLALHLTFDFSRDRLIWDTGHQIYPHKLITGRYKQFDTIRTRGGLMGYPNPHESPYDLFMTGHAGCSVSSALGLKVGDDLLGQDDRHSVAVIGDGALPSGIVFEALNNASARWPTASTRPGLRTSTRGRSGTSATSSNTSRSWAASPRRPSSRSRTP